MKAKELIDYFNTTYSRLHSAFEKAFWDFRMGITADGKKMNNGEIARDAFRSNKKLKEKVEAKIKWLKSLKGVAKNSKQNKELLRRLEVWNRFFGLYQIPDHAVAIRKKVTELEEKILKVHSTRKEGYLDPKTGDVVEASRNKMRIMMRTNPDEAIRKACFDAMEELPLETLNDYIEVIKYRNEYARALGYEDFYDYKIHLDEGMTKDQLFSIFEKIYEKTKYAFLNIRNLEKEQGKKRSDKYFELRKPWNFGYLMMGDFTKEEDPYFQFENVLSYWGKSFSALGIDYKGGEIKLDLLDRKGKWDNGFCHYPTLVHYDKKGRFVAGSSGFTSTAIPWQMGSGIQGIDTVFHEAGHAADRLNSVQEDVCLNTEYPPATVSWAETHSMFMDTISCSIEWKMRYARDTHGKSYPFDLYERKVKATHLLFPLEMMGIIFVMDFERRIYECKDLTKEFVMKTAKDVYKKYFDKSEDSLLILNTPHIYSWESSAYYHGYGLAELAVHQWREYFFRKYGYIVDNKKVGKEMEKVWKCGSLYTSGKFIKMATGKSLSADIFIKNVTRTIPEILKTAKQRIARSDKIPLYKKPIKLNAKITMVHGNKKISDSSKSFEDMDQKYRKWLRALPQS